MCFLIIVILLLNVTLVIIKSTFANPTYTIATEDFCWSADRFPLKVLIDVNQWSTQEYVVAVHEALDSWVHGIWNYTDTYGSNLPNINYTFYVSNVNATSSPDVIITFSPTEIPPNSGIVGLTQSSWNPLTHEPVAPTIINVTTLQGTVPALFVEDTAMHEFGHALGLGHAAQATTSNGPELMYASSSKSQTTYPSTLDVYALTQLYQGTYDQPEVQLPSTMPYVMLSGQGLPPQPSPTPTPTPTTPYVQDVISIAVILIVIVITLVIWRANKKMEHSQVPPPESPPIETPQNSKGQ